MTNKADMLPSGWDQVEETPVETQPEDDKPDTAPTDPETETVPETDTETEPAAAPEEEPAAEPAEPEPDDILARHGLRDQFGSVDEALSRIKDANAYTDQVLKQNATYRRLLDAQLARQQTPEKALTRDEVIERFNEDPIGTIREAGFVSREELERQEQELQALRAKDHFNTVAAVVAEIPELKNVAPAFRLGRTPIPGVNQYWDTMDRIYRANPGLKDADQTALIPLLFNEAKRVLGNSVKRPPVQKVPPDKKAGASTTSKGANPKSVTVPNFNKMEPEEIEKWYEERGLVS